MGSEALLNIRWDFFSSQLTSTLDMCYEQQHFVDTSLVCKDGTIIKCHKMILAGGSTFFQRLLVKNDHPHPMIILHDIESNDLKTIINFMYCGEIEVVKSKVRRLLKIAEILEISGLKDIRTTGKLKNDCSTASRISSTPIIIENIKKPNNKDDYDNNDDDDDNDDDNNNNDYNDDGDGDGEDEDEDDDNSGNNENKNDGNSGDINKDKSIVVTQPRKSKPQNIKIKSNYNLRQRNVGNKENNIDKHESDNKKKNTICRGNNSNNEATCSTKAVISNNNDAINYHNTNKYRKKLHINEKMPIKRHNITENCKYMKKLRLLNEVEVICKTNSENGLLMDDTKSSVSNERSLFDCGMFIKEEIDISSDDEFSSRLSCLKHIGRRKRILYPGVEIFRVASIPQRHSLPNTSRASSTC